MVILFYALVVMLVIFLIYKLGFKYKIINQAIALTAMVMLFIVVPLQVKIMMLVVSFVYIVSLFVVDDNESKSETKGEVA